MCSKKCRLKWFKKKINSLQFLNLLWIIVNLHDLQIYFIPYFLTLMFNVACSFLLVRFKDTEYVVKF